MAGNGFIAPRNGAAPMKAILRDGYGSPDVLKLKEVEKPVPPAGRVLLKVKASSVNAMESHLTDGGLARFLGEGIRKPKDPRIGTDVAGTVESLGEGVTKLKPGDQVFGAAGGAYAEYAVAREDRLVPLPTGRSFEEAAAVPVAGVTALQGIRDRAKVKAGQMVLVNGASGGVGSFAVQIAKSMGAEVWGVCSTKNVEMVKSLGAAGVVDYTKEDFAKMEQKFDVVYDAVGNRSMSDLRKALKPGGVAVVTGFSGVLRLLSVMLLGSLTSKWNSKKVWFQGIAQFNELDLQALAEMLGSRKISPVVSGRYPLAQTPEAVRLQGTRHVSGKLVIEVS